jgi:hypothetical protein
VFAEGNMSEKNGSPRLTAATAGAGEDVEPEQLVRSRQPRSKERPLPAHDKVDGEQEAERMEPQQPSDLHNPSRGMLDRSLQAQLGRQLRAIFSDVAEEPVPERFVKLLEALEAKEKRR